MCSYVLDPGTMKQEPVFIKEEPPWENDSDFLDFGGINAGNHLLSKLAVTITSLSVIFNVDY